MSFILFWMEVDPISKPTQQATSKRKKKGKGELICKKRVRGKRVARDNRYDDTQGVYQLEQNAR